MDSACNRSEERAGYPGKSECLSGIQRRPSLTAVQPTGVPCAEGSSWVSGARVLVSILLITTAALAAGILAAQSLVSPPGAVTPASTASMGNADGLWFTVQSAVWAGRDRKPEQHVPVSPGSKPASKPHGLQVEIKVQNRGDGSRILGPQDFRLQAQNGTTSAPTGQSFPLTLLGPRQYLHSVLSFDVPETSSGMQLVWIRSGHEVRILIAPATLARGGSEPNADDVSSCLSTVEVRCAGGPRPSSVRAEGKQ